MRRKHNTMNTYTVKYVSFGSSGTQSVKADSASDARTIVESSGATVYEVSGPGGTIKFGSYTDAVNFQKQRR